jgi:hypothetical protein
MKYTCFNCKGNTDLFEIVYALFENSNSLKISLYVLLLDITNNNDTNIT